MLVRSEIRLPSPSAVAAIAATRSASLSEKSCAMARPSWDAIMTPLSSGIARRIAVITSLKSLCLLLPYLPSILLPSGVVRYVTLD